MGSPRARDLRQHSASGPRIAATYGSYRATDLNRAREINRYGSGDRHADDGSRALARELARDQDRSSGIYRAIVTAFLDACIGRGVQPIPTSADPQWNALAAALFERESAGIDRSGGRASGFDLEQVDTYGGLQRKWARAIVNDGDLALVKLNDGRLATIEADRLDGKLTAGLNQYRRLTGGILIDTGTGERLGYLVSPYNATGTYVDTAAAKIYPANQVIYCGTSSRKSQARSLPALIAVLDDAERADSLVEASIITAEQASLIWGFISDDIGNAAGGSPDPLAAINSDGTTALGGRPDSGTGAGAVTWQDWVAGTMAFLGKRKFNQAQTALPNLNVPVFLQSIIRIFAAELGVPYELAFLDIGKLSWSANKALLAFCERRLQVWRDQVFGPMFSEIYRWRIADAIRTGKLPDRDDWWRHDHAWPRPPETDGPDQVTTDRGNLDLGRTSLHRLVGADWKTILNEQAEEQRLRDSQAVARVVAVHQAIAAAKKGNPDLELTWPQILTLGGATMAPGAYLAASAKTTTAEKTGTPTPDDVTVTSPDSP